MDSEDFPSSPGHNVDPKVIAAAYLNAKNALEKINLPIKAKKDYLIKLVEYFYTSGSDGKELFRSTDIEANVLGNIWLAEVRSTAEWISASTDLKEFKGLNEKTIHEIVQQSRNIDIYKMLPKIMAELGIVLIYKKAMPGSKVDGAVFLIDKKIPVIGLSLRYTRVDHFWFTLAHELAHIHKHINILEVPILDDFDQTELAEIEMVANKVAADFLIPRSEWRSCIARRTKNEADIKEFAKRLNIAPEIVAGRLRKEFNQYHLFGNIINSVNVREVIFG